MTDLSLRNQILQKLSDYQSTYGNGSQSIAELIDSDSGNGDGVLKLTEFKKFIKAQFSDADNKTALIKEAKALFGSINTVKSGKIETNETKSNGKAKTVKEKNALDEDEAAALDAKIEIYSLKYEAVKETTIVAACKELGITADDLMNDATLDARITKAINNGDSDLSSEGIQTIVKNYLADLGADGIGTATTPITQANDTQLKVLTNVLKTALYASDSAYKDTLEKLKDNGYEDLITNVMSNYISSTITTGKTMTELKQGIDADAFMATDEMQELIKVGDLSTDNNEIYNALSEAFGEDIATVFKQNGKNYSAYTDIVSSVFSEYLSGTIQADEVADKIVEDLKNESNLLAKFGYNTDTKDLESLYNDYTSSSLLAEKIAAAKDYCAKADEMGYTSILNDVFAGVNYNTYLNNIRSVSTSESKAIETLDNKMQTLHTRIYSQEQYGGKTAADIENDKTITLNDISLANLLSGQQLSAIELSGFHRNGSNSMNESKVEAKASIATWAQTLQQALIDAGYSELLVNKAATTTVNYYNAVIDAIYDNQYGDGDNGYTTLSFSYNDADGNSHSVSNATSYQYTRDKEKDCGGFDGLTGGGYKQPGNFWSKLAGIATMGLVGDSFWNGWQNETDSGVAGSGTSSTKDYSEVDSGFTGIQMNESYNNTNTYKFGLRLNEFAQKFVGFMALSM